MKTELEEYPAEELTDEILDAHYFLLKMERIDYEKYLEKKIQDKPVATYTEKQGEEMNGK